MKSKFSFMLSLMFLFIGLIGGFVLLSYVYTGPTWVKLLVFVIVVLVVICLGVALKRFFHAVDELENEKKK